MKPSLLGFTRRIHLHSTAVVAVLMMLVAASGSATAQVIATVTVQVTVVAATTTPSPKLYCSGPQEGYLVCVDTEPVPTPGPAKGDVEIIWKMMTSGWSFEDSGGIYIQKHNKWKVKPKAQQYTATNKKEGSVKYKYDINIYKGSTSLTFDPTIMN